MSSTDVGAAPRTDAAAPGTIDMKLEAVTLPVSDVDRAKRFYLRLGWRLDVDLLVGDDVRLVQFTPPHSQCSIHFGKGVTPAAPGSADRLLLAVLDIESARQDLVDRGVDVSELFHRGESGFAPGRHPQRASYGTYATFRDPDGNGWLLQEITTRLPGREWEDGQEVASLAARLHETALRHDHFEKTHAPHDWWDWYAAYLDARDHGDTPERASDAAARYMADVLHVASL